MCHLARASMIKFYVICVHYFPNLANLLLRMRLSVKNGSQKSSQESIRLGQLGKSILLEPVANVEPYMSGFFSTYFGKTCYSHTYNLYKGNLDTYQSLS